ncbi:EthD domain-containing protein [Microbacterium sp. NPDC055910]|uniref:EthD domain-containing protein n=1 Tax=Microbacterium sp. NPDC055910 TaxID=3345659 RepID=UPI0035D550C6
MTLIDEQDSPHGGPEASGTGPRKVMVLLTKRADLTREQFIRYYEDHHVPLVRRLLPSIGEYRRNYLDTTTGARQTPPPDLGFDVVTELWFEDDAAWEKFRSDLQSPEVTAVLAEDEANFLDRTRNCSVGVDVYPR